MFSSTEITDFPKLRSSTCAVNQTGLKLAIQDRLPLNKWDFNSRVSLAFCGHYLRTLLVAVGFFPSSFGWKTPNLPFSANTTLKKNFFFINFWLHLGYGAKLKSWQKTRKWLTAIASWECLSAVSKMYVEMPSSKLIQFIMFRDKFTYSVRFCFICEDFTFQFVVA